ncbi:MAG: hypothetical protein QHH26_11635 [Armatimonadota bacterium]|nr:hypothetical protein [Armatimonadota bacterium]
MARYTSLAIILAFGLMIAGCGGGGGGGGSSLTISPSSVTLNVGGTKTFTASEPVDWRVAELNGGTITTGGVYTAPNVAGTYHIVATSKANPTKVAIATVFVAANGTSVIIDPSSVALRPGGKVTFYSNVPVNWRVQETNGGTIVPLSETSAEYTAPSRNGDYHVIGTSKADPTKSGTANIFVDSDLPPPPPG